MSFLQSFKISFVFLACNGFFWGGGVYLPKLKKGLGPASAAHFLDDFSIKSVLYLIKCSLSISFSVMPFFLFKISFFRQLISLFRLFRQLIISQISKFIFNHPLKQCLTREKQGKAAVPKFEYLENKKRFLDEIKSIFHISGTSFKLVNTLETVQDEMTKESPYWPIIQVYLKIRQKLNICQIIQNSLVYQ